MGLDLDTVLSAASYFARRWTPELTRNQGRDLLRFVLCRLYNNGRGNFHAASLTLAQGTLARKLGLSRQWVGTLLQRLRDAGWIEYHAPHVGAGMRGSTVIRIGRATKRLLAMLAASRRKSRTQSAVKPRWQFSPKSTNIYSAIHKNADKPLPERILTKHPLLRHWLARGERGT